MNPKLIVFGTLGAGLIAAIYLAWQTLDDPQEEALKTVSTPVAEVADDATVRRAIDRYAASRNQLAEDAEAMKQAAVNARRKLGL